MTISTATQNGSEPSPAFDQGFDRKLIEPYDTGELAATDVTVPLMYNLHAFDWICDRCGLVTYQGPTKTGCVKCGWRTMSCPFSSVASLVTPPLAVSPRTPGSVDVTASSTCGGS